MTSILLAGPGLEPVSLAETKTYLRVSGTEDDQLITTLIAAARVHVQTLTRRIFVTQQWRKILDDWPTNGLVELPHGPVTALLAVRVFAPDGSATELSLSQFIPETNVSPAYIRLPSAIAGEPARRENAAIEIDYSVGFGEQSADVPQDIRQALLTLIAHWYEHREAVLMAGSGAIVPLGFNELIAAYRVHNL